MIANSSCKALAPGDRVLVRMKSLVQGSQYCRQMGAGSIYCVKPDGQSACFKMQPQNAKNQEGI